MTSSTTPIAGSPTTRRCWPWYATRMRDPRREGREGQSASVRAPVRNMAPFRVATSGDIVAMAISTRLGLVGVVVALGALAAGCGGSGSTTASIAGTTVSATVPGTTATLPAA